MQLFYNANLDHSQSQFFFSKEESNHIIKVLRKKEGDMLHITNGKGLIFKAKILSADPKKCKAQIEDEQKFHPTKYQLHMVVAPTKMNDRFDWFLEKATEIGVHQITPIICEHSERKVIKIERMQKVVQAAMKQSLRAYLPKVNEAISFSDFIATTHKDLCFIAHCKDGEKAELKRRVAADKDVTILIGPEGDFSATEIQLAQESGFVPISLGKHRLRTETAALVACTTVTMINNG